MDQDLRRSRHSVTEWNTLATCARRYSWGALGRAPDVAWLELASAPKDASEAAELGTEVHAALAREDHEAVRQLGFTHLVKWMEDRVAPSGPSEVWRELSFELTLGDQVLVGAMDRVELRGERFLLLDFKILQREKSPESLLKSYGLPMRLYAFALGALEPSAQDRTDVLLVAVTPTGLREVEVPLLSFQHLRSLAYEWCQAADAVVRSEPRSIPSPGAHCSTCPYLPHCAEGQGQLQ